MNGKLSIVSQPIEDEEPNAASGTQVSMHIECFMVEKQDEAQLQEDNKVKIQKKAKKSKTKNAAKNRIMFGEEINLEEARKQQAK